MNKGRKDKVKINKYINTFIKLVIQTQLVQYNIAQCSLFLKTELYTIEMAIE